MISASLPIRLLLAAVAASALAAHAQGRIDTQLANTPSRIIPVDRIVAVVNDEVLTANDLNERVQLVIRQLQRQGEIGRAHV